MKLCSIFFRHGHNPGDMYYISPNSMEHIETEGSLKIATLKGSKSFEKQIIQ